MTQCTVTNDDSGGWVQARGTGTPGPATLTFTGGGFTVTKKLTFYSVFVSTDAPDRVDQGSTTSIVVTVVDDEGVRAGAQTVEVTKIAGIALTAAGMTIGIRGARAVYVQDAGGGFDIHVVGAPDFVNARFGQRWIVAATPLTLTLDTEGARAFYVQSADGAFDSHVVGAPDFVNAAFARRWIADAIE